MKYEVTYGYSYQTNYNFQMPFQTKRHCFLTAEKINFFAAFLKYYVYRLLFSYILYINNLTVMIYVSGFINRSYLRQIDFAILAWKGGV